MKGQLEYERDTLAQVKGERPVPAPDGLAPQFLEPARLTLLWKTLLSQAHLDEVEPEVTCDEYPCAVKLKGLGIDRLPRLLSQQMPPEWPNTKSIGFTYSYADGQWTAFAAAVPSEEPQTRLDAVMARLQKRALHGAATP